MIVSRLHDICNVIFATIEIFHTINLVLIILKTCFWIICDFNSNQLLDWHGWQFDLLNVRYSCAMLWTLIFELSLFIFDSLLRATECFFLIVPTFHCCQFRRQDSQSISARSMFLLSSYVHVVWMACGGLPLGMRSALLASPPAASATSSLVLGIEDWLEDVAVAGGRKEVLWLVFLWGKFPWELEKGFELGAVGIPIPGRLGRLKMELVPNMGLPSLNLPDAIKVAFGIPLSKGLADSRGPE